VSQRFSESQCLLGGWKCFIDGPDRYCGVYDEFGSLAFCQRVLQMLADEVVEIFEVFVSG